MLIASGKWWWGRKPLFAAATAAEFSLYALLECLKLWGKLLEEIQIGIFLHHMVKEAHTEHKLLFILILLKETGLMGTGHHIGYVVMAAEVEVEDFGHFPVLSLMFT